jgi:tellurite resistance protein
LSGGVNPLFWAAMSKKTLEELADDIRAELKVPRQSDVFKAAVEAGYLAALADGTVDTKEREILAKAVDILSQGLVIEWETEQLLDDCEGHVKSEGADAHAEAVGKKLAELGQAEAGILVASFVARATNGVEKSEAEVLKKIGKAAGLDAKSVGAIVKRASDALD